VALQGTGRARLLVIAIAVLLITGFAVFLRKLGQRQSLKPANANQNAQPLTTQTPDLTSGQKDSSSPAASVDPNGIQPSPIPSSTASPYAPGLDSPTPQNDQALSKPAISESYVGTLKLIIPVAGVKPDQLLDTFSDARSEGRVHDAIDIPAPAGTPVMATADGEIVKLFQSERGGTTIYQLSLDRKLVFYYAHLQRYTDGLVVAKLVKQGEVIGYVGDSGNAGAGNFHLHFSISIISDPKRYWEGTNINPYPLLHK
jgi:murein DD-endopeptidase MepM/ murein hydrolase activator NlpD